MTRLIARRDPLFNDVRIDCGNLHPNPPDATTQQRGHLWDVQDGGWPHCTSKAHWNKFIILLKNAKGRRYLWFIRCNGWMFFYSQFGMFVREKCKKYPRVQWLCWQRIWLSFWSNSSSKRYLLNAIFLNTVLYDWNHKRQNWTETKSKVLLLQKSQK